MLRHRQGFTVVEIIIGLAVTATFVLSLTIAITNLTEINDRARDLVLVNGLAENKVESLRSKGFNGVGYGTVDFTDELPSTVESPKSAQYVVSDVATAVKQIEINISYTSGGQPQNVNYTTYVGEFGVGQ